LNKLKEYRLIYGDLLSVYELSMIEGWDFQTVRKVIPLSLQEFQMKPGLLKSSIPGFSSKAYYLKLRLIQKKARGIKKFPLKVKAQDNRSTPALRSGCRFDTTLITETGWFLD
jgi:hypothetical protein